MKKVGLLAFFIVPFLTFAQFQWVDPWIGCEGEGRTFIGPSMPYGMVKPGPDCGPRNNSGWAPIPEPITGFSQVHVSGTGGGPKYGNISILPFSGPLDQIEQSAFRLSEDAQLGYYTCEFANSGIKTEITTARKASFYQIQYSFPGERALKIDAGFFLGEQPKPNAREAQQFVGSEIEIVTPYEVRGYSRIRGGWNNGPAYTVYFYALLDQPISEFKTWKGNTLEDVASQFDEGKKSGALLSFGQANKPLKIKIGISYLSELKAKANLEREIPHWDFEKTLNQLRNQWDDHLGKIEISQNVTAKQKKMFYTALYHTMIMPVDRTGENPLWTGDLPYYDDYYCIRDTFRSSTPLITLMDPDREVEIVNAMLNIYMHDGYLPEGRSGNANGRTQGGSNAEVVLADAFVKKLEGIDYELALKAMLKDAEVPPGGNEEQEGRGGLIEYRSLGYVPYGIDRAGNRTVDYSYNDYNIAVVAKGLGKNHIYEEYIQRADSWQNLWRPDYSDHGSTGFIMPKDASGNWLDEVPFGKSKVQKPTFTYTVNTNESPWYNCWWCVFLYEGTSWEYSFSIPHDIPAVIEKSGGEEAFEQRLDTFFEEEFYNVSNEPSFLTPTLYHWVGKPYRSSDRILEIIEQNFNDTRLGLPGNDDSGAMSSWLAFHMMGLYPNAGQPYYLLNTPILESSTFHLKGGQDFIITTKKLSDKNGYIQSAILNGKPLNRAWIYHDEIINGGELVFIMGSKPSDWGTTIRPPKKLGDL